MPFDRLAQVGRVVLVEEGKYTGKLATIVNILDQNRALVHGPTSGVPRVVINLKSMALTKYVIELTVGAKEKALKAALSKDEVDTKFAASIWGKKLARRAEKRTEGDFDRFSRRVARQQKK